MPRRLSGKPSKQSRNDPSRVSSGRIHAPDRIPRFLRIPDLPLERGFIPTVAFGTHRNGRNRDAFAFRTAAAMLFLWLAMLGSVVALQRGEHMRMTALVSKAQPQTQAYLETIAVAVPIVFLAATVLPGIDFTLEEGFITTPA